MRYKLIVADYDDTILRSDLTIPNTLFDAVVKYENRGGYFRIATGRMPCAILPAAKKLGLKGEILTFQGGIVADIETGNVIERTSIPLNIAADVCDYLRGKGIYHHIYEEDSFVANEETEYSEIYKSFCQCPMIVTEKPLSKYLTDKNYEPVKILVMEAPDKISSHMEELLSVFGDVCFITTSKPWLIEIINKNVDKGKAVKKMGEKLGVTAAETIAIGDSLNDLPMIKYAGLGVAVGNAGTDLRRIADVIAPSNDDNGVEYIIRKYGLGENI